MKIMPIKFLILLSIIFTMMANTVNAGEFFYKTVHLGEQCSLSIPFLWKKKEVELNLPANIKPNIEAYQSLQLIGKEVIVTATYANFISRASIDGGIAETVRQLSSSSNTKEFTFSCAQFSIKGGTAKVCRIRYRSGKEYVHSKVLFIVPTSDLTELYSMSGFYKKSYKWGEEVLDKIYRSIKLK